MLTQSLVLELSSSPLKERCEHTHSDTHPWVPCQRPRWSEARRRRWSSAPSWTWPGRQPPAVAAIGRPPPPQKGQRPLSVAAVALRIHAEGESGRRPAPYSSLTNLKIVLFQCVAVCFEVVGLSAFLTISPTTNKMEILPFFFAHFPNCVQVTRDLIRGCAM